MIRRLISQGELNSPWGLVLAPRRFGAFSGDLLVGNFGDGNINAYDPRTGSFKGKLMNSDANVIDINGLWALRFGNGVIGTPQTLLFTAGIGTRITACSARSSSAAAASSTPENRRVRHGGRTRGPR